MLTVEDYGIIRRAHRDGMSIRGIARTYHHSRRKVRDALSHSEPKGYTREKERASPRLGPFKGIIDQILSEDESAPRKQRHTAARIYRRLRDEQGYLGGYDQVRRYVASRRRRERETFIPLTHAPGRRLEADFGHIYVDFPQGRQRVPVFIVTWSFSGFSFALAAPTERVEAVLAGMVEAFAFFGCVPREVWWDNPKTVAQEIFRGRQRRLQERYAALASHYCFEPLFCLPARGNEKPYVENRVYDLQRDWATPVPRVKDYDELNTHLRSCCLRLLDQQRAGQRETIGQRFEREKAVALSLPARPFDPHIVATAVVDKYQTVRFDHNRYTVPRRWAFETVTVKGYVHHLDIVAQGTVVARHHRCYDRGQKLVQPEHYLAILGRRPAALDHSGIFGQWQLPACFHQLREQLEARHGPQSGARQYIRVLQLLAEHPAARVGRAIESVLVAGRQSGLQADVIIQRTWRLAHSVPDAAGHTGEPRAYPPEDAVHVPLPDLHRFDELLTQDKGEPRHGGTPRDVAEDESEAVATADHAGRVREAGPGSRSGECRLSPIPVTVV